MDFGLDGVRQGYASRAEEISKARTRDPEAKRQKRLNNYQQAASGAGAAATGAGAAMLGGHLYGGYKKLDATKKIGDHTVGDMQRAFKPTKSAKAGAGLALGGIGALIAGERIKRYRRSKGRPYSPLPR